MLETHTADIHLRAATTPKSREKFAKVYPKGWDTISALSENPMALKLFSFIAKHCDHLNALVCPIELLAEEFDVNERTIRRAAKWLHDRKHLTIIKVGTANAYILDHTDIWKNYDDYKRYCVFNSRTLASKSQNKLLKTRLSHMVEGQKDFFQEEKFDVDN